MMDEKIDKIIDEAFVVGKAVDPKKPINSDCEKSVKLNIDQKIKCLELAYNFVSSHITPDQWRRMDMEEQQKVFEDIYELTKDTLKAMNNIDIDCL